MFDYTVVVLRGEDNPATILGDVRSVGSMLLEREKMVARSGFDVLRVGPGPRRPHLGGFHSYKGMHSPSCELDTNSHPQLFRPVVETARRIPFQKRATHSSLDTSGMNFGVLSFTFQSLIWVIVIESHFVITPSM